MEPFLAVGELLKKKGHTITCAFPEQFRSLAEESGHGFHSLGPEFTAMLDSDAGKKALGGSGSAFQKMLAYTRLAHTYRSVSRKLVERQQEAVEREQPDRIVHHSKALYPLIWSLTHPGQTILLSPVPYVVHAIREHSHVIFNRNLGPALNLATYSLARWGLVKAVVKAARQLGVKPAVKPGQIREALEKNPAVYTISPSLFPRPAYWPPQYRVLGYHERDKTVAWKPDAALQEFIDRHPKFLLVTFGSMSNPDPEGKTAIIVNILTSLGIPAIINTAGGGLKEPDGYDQKLLHFVAGIPYDWIFPKTYAVVHHGGSGTMHMALKYGCASLIIPHIIDQYLWNSIGYKKGVGPKGPAITALREHSLSSLVRDLWQNPAYKDQARKLAAQMAKEDFREELTEAVIHPVSATSQGA